MRLGNWLAPVGIATPALVHEVAGGLHRLRGERQKGIIAADEEKHSDHRGVARRRAQSRESMQRVQHARIRLSANGTVICFYNIDIVFFGIDRNDVHHMLI